MRQVPTFVVIDLDRTLLKSDELSYEVCDRLITHGVAKDRIEASKAFIRSQAGKSLQESEYLAETFGASLFSELQQEIIVAATHDSGLKQFLYDGACELMDELDKRDIPFGVLTYGSISNQTFKLDFIRALVGRDERMLPAIITSEANKSAWMHHTWQRDNESGFFIPDNFTHTVPLHARSIILLDDKAIHLDTDNDAIAGVLIDNSATPNNNEISIVGFLSYLQTLPFDQPLVLTPDLTYKP